MEQNPSPTPPRCSTGPPARRSGWAFLADELVGRRSSMRRTRYAPAARSSLKTCLRKMFGPQVGRQERLRRVPRPGRGGRRRPSGGRRPRRACLQVGRHLFKAQPGPELQRDRPGPRLRGRAAAGSSRVRSGGGVPGVELVHDPLLDGEEQNARGAQHAGVDEAPGDPDAVAAAEQPRSPPPSCRCSSLAPWGPFRPRSSRTRSATKDDPEGADCFIRRAPNDPGRGRRRPSSSASKRDRRRRRPENEEPQVAAHSATRRSRARSTRKPVPARIDRSARKRTSGTPSVRSRSGSPLPQQAGHGSSSILLHQSRRPGGGGSPGDPTAPRLQLVFEDDGDDSAIDHRRDRLQPDQARAVRRLASNRSTTRSATWLENSFVAETRQGHFHLAPPRGPFSAPRSPSCLRRRSSRAGPPTTSSIPLAATILAASTSAPTLRRRASVASGRGRPPRCGPASATASPTRRRVQDRSRGDASRGGMTNPGTSRRGRRGRRGTPVLRLDGSAFSRSVGAGSPPPAARPR